jgi:hypothetical protein
VAVTSQKFGQLGEEDLQALQKVLQAVLDGWHLSELPDKWRMSGMWSSTLKTSGSLAYRSISREKVKFQWLIT